MHRTGRSSANLSETFNPNVKSRHWVYTINNPTPADSPDLSGQYTYWVVGIEQGEEEGTLHYQGYICFNNRKNMTAVKRIFPRAHLEIMRGTSKQASDYCKEDGLFWEDGDLPDEGGSSGGKKKARNYRLLLDRARNGAFDEIAEDDPSSFVQHYRTLKEIRRDYLKRPADLNGVCGEWIWGPPATGKSTAARRENPDFYDKPLNKWWDGYQGQSCAIIEEVDRESGKWIGPLLKRWADRFSFPAEKKGDTIQIRPHKIVVTSNYSLEQVFGHDDALLEAIKRRFVVRHFLILKKVDDNHDVTLLSDILPDKIETWTPPFSDDYIDTLVVTKPHPIYIPDSDDEFNDEEENALSDELF